MRSTRRYAGGAAGHAPDRPCPGVEPGRRDEDALQVFLSAEEKSPQLVRHSSTAREIVRTLYRRAPVTGGKMSSLLLALAERCRAVSES